MENLLHAYVIDYNFFSCMDVIFLEQMKQGRDRKSACKYYCMDYHFPTADEAGKGHMWVGTLGFTSTCIADVT